jgi:cytoplasmic tRNA 2-thiolation protein 1
VAAFEEEVHHTITSSVLFHKGEQIAIGASGGKDSTVLASVLKTLNDRHGYGLELVLLSVDEGITGYRDDSLKTVKQNAIDYDIPLKIVGYDELYGWTMDEVVETIGKRGNCTYCGVFRRQALDRGAKMLGINHLVTGHNADDVAETVLMNLLRADAPRLSRSTNIMTGHDREGIKRSKPLKYSYEKEIVLYAYHKKLHYFSTECIYSPEAFRGTARSLVKNLEKVRPAAILDIVRSGEDLARLMDGPPTDGCACSVEKAKALEVTSNAECPIRKPTPAAPEGLAMKGGSDQGRVEDDGHTPNKSLNECRRIGKDCNPPAASGGRHKSLLQTLGTCEKCGYMSSQAICQACVLLDSLNKNRAVIQI